MLCNLLMKVVQSEGSEITMTVSLTLDIQSPFRGHCVIKRVDAPKHAASGPVHRPEVKHPHGHVALYHSSVPRGLPIL